MHWSLVGLKSDIQIYQQHKRVEFISIEKLALRKTKEDGKAMGWSKD